MVYRTTVTLNQAKELVEVYHNNPFFFTTENMCTAPYFYFTPEAVVNGFFHSNPDFYAEYEVISHKSLLDLLESLR